MGPENQNQAARARIHSKYRIAVMQGDEVMHKLSVSANESPFKVMDIARRELKQTITATHALVRGLSGKELELNRQHNWLAAQLMALKLKG